MNARALALAPLLASFGCTGGAAEDVDLGSLVVKLWTPEDDDYLDDATEIAVTTLIDGVGQERTFATKEDIALDDIAAAPEGARVSVVIETTGSALPDARARTESVELTPDGGVQETTALFAARDVARRFTTTLPDARDDPAVCAHDDGTILVTGGARGGALVAGSVVFDPRARALTPGPALSLPAAGSACVILDDGRVLLLGGADETGAGNVTLYIAPSVRETTAFSESAVSFAASKRGYGVAMARHGDDVWFLYDDVVERRPIEDLTDVARETLPVAHLFGSLAVDDASAIVVGGFADVDRTTPSDGASLVSAAGGVASIASLAGAQVASRDGQIFALTDDVVTRLTAPGYVLSAGTTIRAVDASARSRTRGAFIALGDDRVAFLDEAGGTVALVNESAARDVTLPQSHAGGAIVRGLSSGVFVVGGVAGSEVVRVDE